MRLLIYNIAYGTGSPRNHWQTLAGAANYLRTSERYFNSIIRLVRHYRPDAAGVLEIDHGSFRTGGKSQLEALAEELQAPFNGAFSCKYAPDSFLSKLPYCRHQTNMLFFRNGSVEAEWNEFMPCGGKRLIRCAVFQEVNILLVHLALSRSVRKRQLNYLETLIESGKKYIICGDFNTFAGAQELSDFMQKNHLQSANEKHQPTYPARTPVKELDYILYSENMQLQNFRVIRFPGSDHLPLLADFT